MANQSNINLETSKLLDEFLDEVYAEIIAGEIHKNDLTFAACIVNYVHDNDKVRLKNRIKELEQLIFEKTFIEVSNG